MSLLLGVLDHGHVCSASPSRIPMKERDDIRDTSRTDETPMSYRYAKRSTALGTCQQIDQFAAEQR